MATENWKTIPGLNDKYEVSDLGRVRNKNTGRFLTPRYKDGNRRNLAVSNLYLKSNSEFRKEEYQEGRLGIQLVKSEFDEWIFGDCLERRTH